jgi:SAM-dependent methyltransferase
MSGLSGGTRVGGPVTAPVPPSTAATARLGSLRELAREFGPAYALLTGALVAARWLPRRIDDALLDIEARRGRLGPAHRRWSEHSVSANRHVWSTWDWSAGGEEWTASEQWKASLIEELLVPAVMGAKTILEIGPGAGRFTVALHDLASRLILVDITDTTLQLCRERLGDPSDVSYILSDGATLRGVDTGSVDAVWSFDAFVHVAPVDVDQYLGEIRRVLAPDGVAVIHHAGRRERRGWRSPMTASLFAALAAEQGLIVRRQVDSWGGDGRYGVSLHGDVISELRRAP